MSAVSSSHPPLSILSKVLSTKVPRYKLPVIEPKNTAKILTSAECRRILEEKKRKKEEEKARKEERKVAREKARMAKAAEAQRKQLLREMRRGTAQSKSHLGKIVACR